MSFLEVALSMFHQISIIPNYTLRKRLCISVFDYNIKVLNGNSIDDTILINHPYSNPMTVHSVLRSILNAIYNKTLLGYTSRTHLKHLEQQEVRPMIHTRDCGCSNTFDGGCFQVTSSNFDYSFLTKYRFVTVRASNGRYIVHRY